MKVYARDRSIVIIKAGKSGFYTRSLRETHACVSLIDRAEKNRGEIKTDPVLPLATRCIERAKKYANETLIIRQ